MLKFPILHLFFRSHEIFFQFFNYYVPILHLKDTIPSQTSCCHICCYPGLEWFLPTQFLLILQDSAELSFSLNVLLILPSYLVLPFSLRALNCNGLSSVTRIWAWAIYLCLLVPNTLSGFFFIVIKEWIDVLINMGKRIETRSYFSLSLSACVF